MSGIGAADVAVTVQVDLSGTAFGNTPTWTDVTADVLTSGNPINITWGRQDWTSDVSASTCSLSLDNADGKYTPGLASSPYSPYVKRRARIRISATVSDESPLTIIDLGDGSYEIDGPPGFYTDNGDGTYTMNVGSWTDLGDGTYSITPVNTTVYLFDGLIDSWETSFEGGQFSETAVSATDMLGRLSSDILNPMGYEEILLDSPNYFYPLNDQGPTFGDMQSAGPVMTSNPGFAGLGVTYQNVTYPPNVSVNISDPDIVGVGLQGYDSFLEFGASLPLSSNAFEMHFVTINTSFASQLVLDNAGIGVGIKTNGFLATTPTGANIGSIPVNDGRVHQLALQGGTIWLDGGDTGVAHSLANVAGLGFNFVGTVFNAASFPGSVSSTRLLQHFYGSGGWGFTHPPSFFGESTSQHVNRLLSYRVNFGSVVDTGVGKVGVHSTSGEDLQQALYDTAEAEGGVVFADGQGRIVFRSRNHMFSPSSVLTLDASQDQVSTTTLFRDDIQYLLNDVTVTTPAGATQRYFDPTSVTADGTAATQVDLIIDNDVDALAAATWRVQVGVQEQTSATQLDVNLFAMTDGPTIAGVLSLQTLDVLTLANLPATAPTTEEFMVQGGTLTIGIDQFDASIFSTVVPAGSPY